MTVTGIVEIVVFAIIAVFAVRFFMEAWLRRPASIIRVILAMVEAG